jgi:hypothetical protein
MVISASHRVGKRFAAVSQSLTCLHLLGNVPRQLMLVFKACTDPCLDRRLSSEEFAFLVNVKGFRKNAILS